MRFVGLLVGVLGACGSPAARPTPPAVETPTPALAPLRPLGAAQAAEFRAAFEANPGKTRILAALSPT